MLGLADACPRGDVDLNPHRAGIGRSLEELPHTGIALRIAAEKRAQDALENRTTAAADADLPRSETATPPSRHLAPVAGHNRLSDCLPISTAQYLALAAWTAGIPVQAGTDPPSDTSRALAQTTLRTVLDCEPGDWLAQLTAIRERWRIAGGSAPERAWLERRNQRWVRKPVRRSDEVLQERLAKAA